MTASHTRYVSIEKESTYGTEPSGTPAIGEVESETFQVQYDVAKRADMNYYGAAKSVVGKKFAEGGVSMALQPDKFLANCVMGIFGSHDNNTNAGPHTFSEIAVTATTELPSYTFRVGRDDKEYTYTGQVIESLGVSASMGEYAMVSVSTVGKGDESLASLSTSVTGYTGDACHFARAFVAFEETATNSAATSKLVQSVDFEIKTNRDVDNSYALGSQTCVRAPPVTNREVTGSITFHKAVLTADVSDNEISYDELRGATNASNTAMVNPGSAAPALSLLFEVTGASESIRFDFFKVQYEMAETSVSGRDSQTMTVNFHALYDLGDANKMVECVITSTNEIANGDTF